MNSSFSLLQFNCGKGRTKQVGTKVNMGYQLFYYSFFRFFFLDSLSTFAVLQFDDSFCCLFLKLSKNNIFLTLVNNVGDVLISLSSGKVGLSSSKRKTTFAVRLLIKSLLVFLTEKQQGQIKFFSVQTNWLKLSRLVISLFRDAGVVVHYLLFSMAHEHGLGLRKRKARRL